MSVTKPCTFPHCSCEWGCDTAINQCDCCQKTDVEGRHVSSDVMGDFSICDECDRKEYERNGVKYD